MTNTPRPETAWRRLLRMGTPRPTKANLLVALLAVALGVAIVAQVQQNRDGGLSRLRQDELVKLLDEATQRANTLDTQIRRLEAQRDRLQSGAGSTQEAIEQARKRADQLGILTGTVAAEGPGITVTITDSDGKVTPQAMVDTIQELRDAGAEAIDVGGVRIVASTAVTGRPGELSIGDTRLGRTIEVTALGNPPTMATAMNIPGGVVVTMRTLGATATVRESSTLKVTSLHTPKPSRYAHAVPHNPAAPPSAPTPSPSAPAS